MVFVVDSSSNLRYRDFRLYVLGTVADIIQHLDVDLGTTRVALVQFTNRAEVRLIFAHLDCVISVSHKINKW